MVYTAVIISLLVALIAAASALHFYHKRYVTFVTKYSNCLHALKELNSEFSFYDIIDFEQSHTYDNENFYETIECEDYLIYQLQFESKQAIEQIKHANSNKIEYNKYIDRLKGLHLGDFSAPYGKLKERKLLKTEKKLCHASKLPSPPMEFSYKVTLYCSSMNGSIQASKSQTFSAETIMSLIKRLRDRDGTFYRDREIWDSICRVERGKVSNKMRFSIYARDGYRCCKCGVSQRKALLEIDHIIPIAKGGKSTYDNLQTLCHECNVKKGDKI